MKDKKVNKFFQPGSASEAYERYRDDSRFVEDQKFIEWMYEEYKGFEDTNFLEDAKQHFWQRLWEMHVHVTLIHKGFNLLHTHDNELDHKILLKDNRVIWVEATLPTKGTGINAAPVRTEYWGDVDEYIDPIIPRITQVLREKKSQVDAKGLEAPVLVAITGADVDDLAGGTDLDLIEGVLYGRGRLRMNREREMSYGTKRPVFNNNGKPIPIGLFEDPAYQRISAVLYRHKHPAVTPVEERSDILVIHNHKALHPIAWEDFPLGHHRQWFVGEGEIRGKDFEAPPLLSPL